MHSKSFENLKTINEKLGRYSSKQLISVLDTLVLRSLLPIIEHTDFIDRYIAVVIGWYSTNHRRKISSLSNRKYAMLLFTLFLAETNPNKKLAILKNLRLERNILRTMVGSWLDLSKDYQRLSIEVLKEKDLLKSSTIRARMWEIETAVGVLPNGHLYPAISRAEYWHKMGLDFRNLIIERYVRYAVMKAHGYYKTNMGRVDLDDLVQNYMLAISRGIDKYDSKRGTLTNYINQWIRNAQLNSDSPHEYGIAYSVPQNVRRQMADGNTYGRVNISSSLEDEGVESQFDTTYAEISSPQDIAERESEIEEIRKIAKYADPVGFARIDMGIEEYLSKEEVAILIRCKSPKKEEVD